MAKVDLSSQAWCDLVFSGKNKAYGAYKMRETSPRRHNIAVVLVIVIALIGFSIPALIKMATPKQKEVMTEVTTLSQLEEPEVKQEEMKRIEPVAPPPALKSSIKFTAPVIKKDEEVRDEDEIKSQTELTETKVAISIADVKGNDEEHGKDIADLKQVVTQAEPEPEKVFDMVEQMPRFPGGQTEMMQFICKNMKYPTIARENGTQGRVTCQFVVDADGKVRDVKILRGIDPYLDKEAVRVIMSMPRWIPDKQNGQAVSVKYTIPGIAINVCVMKTLKQLQLSGLLVLQALLSACQGKPRDGQTDTCTSGVIAIAADESFRPIVQEEITDYIEVGTGSRHPAGARGERQG